MSLQTDIIFVKAIRSNTTLIAQLPAGDVYNASIAVPDIDLDNAPVPYVIVSFNGLTNETLTKDEMYEGSTDRVQIGVEVAAKTRPQLGALVASIRKTIREFFINASPTDEDFRLVPVDYQFSAQGVLYDSDKPCYWQVLNYNCETNIDEDEQEED